MVRIPHRAIGYIKFEEDCCLLLKVKWLGDLRIVVLFVFLAHFLFFGTRMGPLPALVGG